MSDGAYGDNKTAPRKALKESITAGIISFPQDHGPENAQKVFSYYYYYYYDYHYCYYYYYFYWTLDSDIPPKSRAENRQRVWPGRPIEHPLKFLWGSPRNTVYIYIYIYICIFIICIYIYIYIYYIYIYSYTFSWNRIWSLVHALLAWASGAHPGRF